MEKKTIGIVCNGRRGEAIAMCFAKHNMYVRIYETGLERSAHYRSNSSPFFEVIGLRGNVSKVPVDTEKISWVTDLAEFSVCELVIEVLPDSCMEEKLGFIKQLDSVCKADIPVLSNSYLHLPSLLAQDLSDDSRFAVAYFYDIEYTATNVELVCHDKTRLEAAEKAKTILTAGGFLPFIMQECPGFIHNRVGCMGIMSLMRFYDKNVISYTNLCKYFILTRIVPYILNIPLGIEIRTELFFLSPLMRVLNKHYGERFYLPAFFKKEFNAENMEEIISSTSTELVSAGENSGVQDQVKCVYLTGLNVIHENILYALLNNKVTVFFDKKNGSYIKRLESKNPRLYKRFNTEVRLLNMGNKTHPPSDMACDLVMDFHIETLERKQERLRNIQEYFGGHVPVMVNTPVFKISELAEDALHPSMIVGFYTQKNYLTNTELVRSRNVGPETYVRVRQFISRIATQYIETKDCDVRPLCFMVLSKMLESVRILEEGLADTGAIDILGVDRSVFRDMDLWGLDTVRFICQYLEPKYGELFRLPAVIRDKIRAGKTGYSSGEGFFTYE